MEAERKGKLLQEALSIHTFLNEVRVLLLDVCVVVFQFVTECVCVCRCLSWRCGWRSSEQGWNLRTVEGVRRRQRLC